MAFVASCVGACFSAQGDLASSRLATVYSLTQFGTWDIDQPTNPFARDTVDKVTVRGIEEDGIMRGGHLISSKPPVMPLVMTGVYLAAHALAGWTLENPQDVNALLLLTTVLLVSIPYALAIAFFYKTLALFDVPARTGLLLLAALAFGTQVGGFSTTINNHVPAAGALAVALYVALGLLTGRHTPAPWRFAVFGFAGALVPTLDMPAGIYIFAVGCALFVQYPRQTALWTLLAGGPPLLAHVWGTWAATGNIIPVQAHEATYMYESAYWRHPLGIDALSEPKLTYLFHITFGRCGVFSLYPVTFLGIIGAAAALRTSNALLRRACLLGFASFVLLTAYYVRSTHNYGGEAYGFRWYIASMPVLLLMAIPALVRTQRAWQWSIVGLMLAISMYSTAECVYVGWESGKEWTSRIFGPAYAQVSDNSTVH